MSSWIIASVLLLNLTGGSAAAAAPEADAAIPACVKCRVGAGGTCTTPYITVDPLRRALRRTATSVSMAQFKVSERASGRIVDSGRVGAGGPTTSTRLIQNVTGAYRAEIRGALGSTVELCRL